MGSGVVAMQAATAMRAEASAAERAREAAMNPAQGRATAPEAPPPPPPEVRTEATAQEARRPDPPQPVINERGQKTGTIVNTTA